MRRVGIGLAGWVGRIGSALRHQRRAQGVAIVAALLLLALTGALVTLAAQPAKPKLKATPIAQQATDTVAPTDTATSTATATATPSPIPTNAPAKKLAAPPPPAPPSIPTPPPNPTTDFCPTPTPVPTSTPQPTSPPTVAPSPTATSAATTPSASPSTTASPGATTTTAHGLPLDAHRPACQNCPYYKGNNPSQGEIAAALDAAADTYGLPRNLVRAVAWQESKWHADVTSCDGGIGLMQIQYYTYGWLNGVSVSACHLGVTSYDPNTAQGSAMLGAKFLAYLGCFYSYWGNNGGVSTSSPGAYTSAKYYQSAHLAYPDPTLCGNVYTDPNHPEYAALPASNPTFWSCPFSATAGDLTVLDITISAYNEGPGNIAKYGVNNLWYVQGVETKITQMASGALPVAS